MKKEMTILQICDYSADYRGNFIDSLASLEENNENIKNIYLFPHRVICTNAKGWINEINKNEKCAYIQTDSFIKNIFLLRKIIKQHKVDFIIRHFWDIKIDIIVKLLFNSKKVVRFCHMMFPTNFSKLKTILCKFLWNHNSLVGVSEAGSNRLKAKFGSFNVTTIENAICFDRLDKSNKYEKKPFPSLFMMGWDKERKGVDLALKVVEKLRNEYAVSLFISVAANADSVKDFVKNTLGYHPDWVEYLPPDNNVATYFNATDIFLSPSRSEAFGYAVVEAAYCKKSIVASKIDGQGELKIDGAYWFETENLDDFYIALKKAVEEFGLPEKEKQKEETKNDILKTYSIKAWDDKVLDLLKKIS